MTGQGAVGHGLAAQEGGEGLGDLGDFLQLRHGADPPLALWEDPACSRTVTGRVAGYAPNLPRPFPRKDLPE
jgi:hypothetical protein